ncbi:MAG: glutaminase A [Leucobacter sp.]
MFEAEVPLFNADVLDVTQRAFTGELPAKVEIDDLIERTHQRYADVSEGAVADYIPILAKTDPSLFGLSLAGRNGEIHETGDVDVTFSIQSISKAFVFALVCDEVGHAEVTNRIGVNNTGLPFDSVVAVEINDGKPMNPMVNAGAISTTAMMPAMSAEERWQKIRGGLSKFAGRDLVLDGEVNRSERFTNRRNHAIARLLDSYDRLDANPAETVDVYTRQCSLRVTTRDLAVMGATLAGAGVNPITGEQVVSAEVARDTLSVLAACGMYERSGEWLFEIGLPAKSGVSGGIVAIAPGKGAVGVFSPPLDIAGNSIRGQRACAYLSRALGLNVFAS